MTRPMLWHSLGEEIHPSLRSVVVVAEPTYETYGTKSVELAFESWLDTNIGPGKWYLCRSRSHNNSVAIHFRNDVDAAKFLEAHDAGTIAAPKRVERTRYYLVLRAVGVSGRKARSAAWRMTRHKKYLITNHKKE